MPGIFWRIVGNPGATPPPGCDFASNEVQEQVGSGAGGLKNIYILINSLIKL